MTKEEVKELLPIMQAFAEGDEIQYRNNYNEWIDVKTGEGLCFTRPSSCYRIKPEPRYRPFKTQEECWQEMLNHQPFGWLKSKKDGRFRCIGEVSWSDEFETVCIALSTNLSSSRSANSMFDEYTFADGVPFGVMEE